MQTGSRARPFCCETKGPSLYGYCTAVVFHIGINASPYTKSGHDYKEEQKNKNKKSKSKSDDDVYTCVDCQLWTDGSVTFVALLMGDDLVKWLSHAVKKRILNGVVSFDLLLVQGAAAYMSKKIKIKINKNWGWSWSCNWNWN